WMLAKLLASYWLDLPFRLRTRRHRRLALGNALVARCLASLFERDIPVWRECALDELVTEGGAVTGAVVRRGGKVTFIRARRGVVLAAGGVEGNRGVRSSHLSAPTNTDWSAGNGNNTGDAIRAAESAGADLGLMDEAWWAPAYRLEGEDRARILFVERGLPGVYLVDCQGERFVDEASSYYHVGEALNRIGGQAWLIFDAEARHRFPIGPLLPGIVQPDKAWSAAVRKIVKRANSLRGLAALIGCRPAALERTAARVAK